jgi:hypothetical protein
MRASAIQFSTGRTVVLLRAFTLLLAVAGLSAAPRLEGQVTSGIKGTITDSSGAVVAGATVTATNVSTGVTSHSSTSTAGTYTILDLIPGTYRVRVEKAGFRAAVVQNVNVDVASKATADAVLTAGQVAETVEVKAQAITLETEQPDNGTVVEKELVQELPLEFGSAIGARDRQIDSFASITPGFTGASFSHRINGGVDFQNEVVFNGIPAVQSETQGMQTNINPPYELVSQFRVLNSVFSPQYGLGQGVAVYQFASGTNALHGDAFDIERNSFLDAPGVFPPNTVVDPATGQILKKPTPLDVEHNWGFTVGGPVYIPHVYDGRNKTFFYFSADWYRFNAPAGGPITVPTGAEKSGDFSALCQSGFSAGICNDRDSNSKVLNQIYAPTVFTPPSGCGITPGQAFAGNVIPAGCFSSISNRLLSLVPNPTLGGLVNNLPTQITGDPTRQFNFGMNFDHNLTSTQTIHVSYWRDKWNQPNCCDNAAYFATSSPLTGVKTEPRLGTGVFVTYAKTFSPHLLMTAGMGWMGEINNENNLHLGFSFPGVTNGLVFPRIGFGCKGSTSCPNFAPTDWGAGNNGEYFSHNRKLGLSWANNWLYTHGRHTLNIGFDARRAYQDDQECQNCGAGIYFSPATTSDPSTGNGGDGFASFLLGEVDSVTRNFAIEEYLRNFAFSPYIQDNLKITPKLTVNLGLRWDILRPFTEKQDNIVFFRPNIADPGAINPATGQPLMGGLTKFGSCTGCAAINHVAIDWHQFSPRVGFAYELNHKTAILGGFAVNRLNGGAYEFGTNKVAVNYGNLLAGVFNRPSLGSNVPGYGEWDNNPIPQPAATPFSPQMGNGHGVNALSSDAGFAPYNEAWNFGVQREMPQNMVFTVSYVGNRGIHLPSQLNPINQMNPALLNLCANVAPNNCVLGQPWNSTAAQAVLQSMGYGQASGLFTPYVNFINDFPGANLQQALLPYPMYSGLTDNFEHAGSSLYNAMQVQAEKRFSSGLSFLANYTLSRMMSNSNSGFTVFESTAINKYNQKSEWTIDNNDQTHLVNITMVYELPIGPGKRLLNRGGLAARNLLGGWQFSVVAQYSSGQPFWDNAPSLGAPGSPLNTGNRGNYTPTGSLQVDWNNYYKGLPVFNVADFSLPTGCVSNSCWTLGTSPRILSVVRGTFNENENMGLGKHFYFGEHVTAELRVEFFNIFNRVMVGGADNNTNDIGSTFGLVCGGTRTCQGNNSPRQGQGFLKISF